MKHLVLGVIGHVDHGKTTLVEALTGTDTDQLAEEKRRGISIALGFAHLNIDDDTEIDLIDMPGHERFVRTLVSGATGIDGVMLVVAGNEGIKPQTEEHIDIAALLGVPQVLVAITKTDLTTTEQAQVVADEVVQMVVGRGLKSLPPVMVSALRREGIEALWNALGTLAAEHRPRALQGIPFLPVDRAFSIPGHGPVVTGTLRGASISTEDTLEILPPQGKVRVRAIQVHGVPVTRGLPGQRVAINLRNIEISQLQRGMVLAAPGSLSLTDWLTISIQSVASAPPLKNGLELRALLGTQDVDVRLRLLDRDVLKAGQSAFAQLRCSDPVAIPAGEHLILRIASPPQTVAGGKILEPEAVRRRRKDKQVLERLTDLSSLPFEEMVAGEIRRAGMAGISLQQLSRLSALPVVHIVNMLESLRTVITGSGIVVGRSSMDRLESQIPPLLGAHPSGLSLKQLASALPGSSAVVLEQALANLRDSGAIKNSAGQVTLSRPDEDRAIATKEAEFVSQVAETLRREGLAPPTPRELLVNPRIQRAMGRLLREGVVISAVDRAKGREILFHRDAVEEAKRCLIPQLNLGPGLRVTEIGAILGISRKYSVPLLNYLDEIHFTRRIKDRRVLFSVASTQD